MTKILAIALGLAQMRSCAGSFCAALDTDRFAARAMRLSATAPQRVIDVASIGGGALLVVSGATNNPEDYERSVERWSERRGAEPLIRLRLRDVIGEGIAADGGVRWWYSVAGNSENRWGALFIDSIGRSRFVPLPVYGGNRWLSLKGDVPSGLYLFQDRDDTHAMEVTAEGIQRTWSVSGAQRTMRRWWSAERLADGSIALASLEGLPGRLPSRIVVRILRRGDDARYDEFLLESGAEVERIACALQRSGTLAVVVERPQGAIDAFLVDVGTQKSRGPLRLSGPDEKARYPAVAATSTGFTVAWIDIGAASARARSIETGAAGLLPMTVGTIAVTPDREPVLRAVSEDEEAVFVWERGDGAIERRLPAQLSGFELIVALRTRLCSFAQRQSQRP